MKPFLSAVPNHAAERSVRFLSIVIYSSNGIMRSPPPDVATLIKTGCKHQLLQPPPRAEFLLFIFVIDVEEHGCQQHQAFDHLLIIDADTHDGHAVVHHSHDEGANDRAHHLADTAGCRRAADEASRDHVQLKTSTGFW